MSSSIALTTSYSFPFKSLPSLKSRYKPRISSPHSPFTSSSSFRPLTLTLTLPSSSIVGIITQPLPLGAALLTKTLTFAAALSAFGDLIPWLVKSLCQACGSNVGDGTEGKLGSWLMLTCFQNSVISSSMFLTAMAANPLSANLAFSTIGKTIGWMDWAKAAIVPGLVSLVVKSSPDAPRLAVTPQFQPPEFDVRPYLSSSMPGPKLKVAVLVSGGVDSSVALRLLHAARHSCTAFYLKIWFQEDFENFWSECPWEEDLAYVKAVCNQIDVPLEVVHLTDEYWEKVVSYIIEEYRNGRTPNPDVLCNTRIKFGAFMDAISTMGFDYVASGHYANVLHPAADVSDQPSILKLSRDVVKDQTYFLSHLDQSQLKRLIFPLGHIPKNEVRKLAMQFDLPNKDRKDSQGICFLGKIKFSDFVARQIGEIEGVILEAETGDFLGKHRGFWFYTIGQRQGLRLPGGPWYVVEKDTENNVIFVSRSYYSVDKRRRVFRVGSLKWLNGKPPEKLGDLQCKVRHGPSMYSCSLTRETCENSHGDVAVVHLSEDDQGLAAGQFAAFYQGNTCIGSGIILESWDDQGFPVCDKALEIARLPDKSKLGKPVKITAKPEDSPA